MVIRKIVVRAWGRIRFATLHTNLRFLILSFFFFIIAEILIFWIQHFNANNLPTWKNKNDLSNKSLFSLPIQHQKLEKNNSKTWYSACIITDPYLEDIVLDVCSWKSRYQPSRSMVRYFSIPMKTFGKRKSSLNPPMNSSNHLLNLCTLFWRQFSIKMDYNKL